MAISKDELKTVAATSAIAAAGSALATTLVSMVMDRYFSEKQGDTGPTFVVVPVVDRPVPALPPAESQNGGGTMAGFGALDPELRKRLSAATPDCYTPQFDRCLDNDAKFLTRCEKYLPWHEAYEQDEMAAEELVDAMPYCSYSPRTMRRNVVLGAAGGFVAGALVIGLIA
jgi:hypothetical protein